MCSVHKNTYLKLHGMESGVVFFLTSPYLADMLYDPDLDLDIFFGRLSDPKFPDAQVPRFSDFQILRRRRRAWTNSQIPT